MLIGLSVNHKEGLSCISNAYVNAVIKAGGTPVLIPLTHDEKVIDETLSRIDGLILSGGGDLHASFFNEELHPAVESYDLERDYYDLTLVKKAAAMQMPILGICRGHQVINVALGGNMIQDIPSQIPQSTIQHSQKEAREVGTHTVKVEPSSLLASLIKNESTMVNSFHHQAIKDLAPGMKAVGFSDDGVIEAIESEDGYSILGVQWHPENMACANNTEMVHLFNHIVSESDLYQQAKNIHKNNIILDSHTDTPMFFSKGAHIGKDNSMTLVDVPKMQKGLIDAVVMVAYIKQEALTKIATQKAVDKTNKILNTLLKQITESDKTVEQARTSADIERLKSENKKAIILGIENAYGIGKNIQNLKHFADMGVTYITLSHNGDNDICDSAMKSKQTHNGLSDFGKEVVREMNRLGIIIDISHTSEKTSFDVLEISQHPIIASHSSAKALRDHPRNISDKLIKAIAQKGGVIQICLYKNFLSADGKANVKTAVDHIDHIVKIAGIDHVGIGSDLDGDGGIFGFANATEAIQMTIELLRRNYSEEDIRKIWGGNFMRVMNTVQNNTN